MVARSPRGETKSFPSATNHHEHQILAWSVIPSLLSPEIEARAQQLACAIADSFTLEGLLAVEMFLTADGDLLVNELAPRPHNSYHASERACVTSQFEQAVRAVCDLPLGDVSVVMPAAIANLLAISGSTTLRISIARWPFRAFAFTSTRNTSRAKAARWAIFPPSVLPPRKPWSGCWKRRRCCEGRAVQCCRVCKLSLSI